MKPVDWLDGMGRQCRFGVMIPGESLGLGLYFCKHEAKYVWWADNHVMGMPLCHQHITDVTRWYEGYRPLLKQYSAPIEQMEMIMQSD